MLLYRFFENRFPNPKKSGVATNQRATCPVCRAPFPVRLISQPPICEDYTEHVDDEVWFYEGRNGWWQYDERTNKIIGTNFRF